MNYSHEEIKKYFKIIMEDIEQILNSDILPNPPEIRLVKLPSIIQDTYRFPPLQKELAYKINEILISLYETVDKISKFKNE